MKKIVAVFMILCVLLVMGANLTTTIRPWQVIDTTTSAQGAVTQYPIDSFNAKDIDLRQGSDTDANASCFMFLATEAVDDAGGTATVEIWGANDNGPREYITSLALTVMASSTADTGTATIQWVDTIVDTSAHYSTVNIIDSGNGRPARVMFDNAGMRYLEIRVRALTGIASLSTYHRFY